MNTSNTFTAKIKALFGSVRFWVVTLTAIVAILESQVGGTDIAGILEIVKIYLITVAGIGTVDSVARKIGGESKPEMTSEQLIELLKADSQK